MWTVRICVSHVLSHRQPLVRTQFASIPLRVTFLPPPPSPLFHTTVSTLVFAHAPAVLGDIFLVSAHRNVGCEGRHLPSVFSMSPQTKNGVHHPSPFSLSLACPFALLIQHTPQTSHPLSYKNNNALKIPPCLLGATGVRETLLFCGKGEGESEPPFPAVELSWGGREVKKDPSACVVLVLLRWSCVS